MTREDKVDKLVNQVDGWDMDTVFEYAKDKMRDYFDGCNDDEVDTEYVSAGYEDDEEECEDCGHEIGDCECEAMEEDEEKEMAADEVCHCDIQQLMSDVGHDEDCPEKPV